MALARPRRQEKQDLRALLARDEVPLVRLEMHERPDRSLDRVARRSDPRRALDDDDPGVLFDLVIAELLARFEADQNGARLVLAQEDDRRAASVRRLDLGQPPALHGRPGV